MPILAGFLPVAQIAKGRSCPYKQAILKGAPAPAGPCPFVSKVPKEPLSRYLPRFR